MSHIPFLLSFVLLTIGAIAQTARTTIEGAMPELQRLVAACRAAIKTPAPPSGRPRAMWVLANLRLADAEGSASALATAKLEGPEHELPWLVAAHLWHVRATGQTDLAIAQWQHLTARAAATTAAPQAATFLDAAMQVHLLFCLGALADAIDQAAHAERWQLGTPTARPGAAWTQRAIDRQIELERQAWQPGREHFRANLTHGAIVTPESGDALTLVPASAGLLLATSDRMRRHLEHVANDVDRDDTTLDDVATAALLLLTQTQLMSDSGRQRALERLLRATAGRVSADHAGLVLDAVLFAITGVRVATGAGLDEAWQRCTPWLPPGHAQLRVRNLLAGGARYDLQLVARDGSRQVDEQDASANAHSDCRLRVTVRCLYTADGRARTVLVAESAMQTMHWLAVGETFSCSLPRAQPNAQHDPQAVGGSRPGIDPNR